MLYVLLSPLAVALFVHIRTQQLAQRVGELEEKLARLEQPLGGVLPTASAYLHDLYSYLDPKG
jgi:hypothetical protein